MSRKAANNNGFRIGFISTQFTKTLCCLLRDLSFAAAQEELKSYKKSRSLKLSYNVQYCLWSFQKPFKFYFSIDVLLQSHKTREPVYRPILYIYLLYIVPYSPPVLIEMLHVNCISFFRCYSIILDIPPLYLFNLIIFSHYFCYISLLFPLLFIYLMFNSYYSPSLPFSPPPLFRQAFQNVSRILYIHSPWLTHKVPE